MQKLETFELQIVYLVYSKKNPPQLPHIHVETNSVFQSNFLLSGL